MDVALASSSSFTSRWEAKKVRRLYDPPKRVTTQARAMARRMEQSSQGGGLPFSTRMSAGGGPSCFSLGGSAIVGGLGRVRGPESDDRASYSRALARQVDEKMARRDAERLARIQYERQDDARVMRERAALRAEAEAERQEQRRRQALVDQRSRHLQSYLDRAGSAPQPSRTYSDNVLHGAPPSRPQISSNVWASGASQNVGNFITDRPTSRVLNPPGGRSSISFG